LDFHPVFGNAGSAAAGDHSAVSICPLREFVYGVKPDLSGAQIRSWRGSRFFASFSPSPFHFDAANMGFHFGWNSFTFDPAGP
jgi:hypothetical protein